ncbi:hypothetical protein [Streptomyces sp. NPDC001876]|uniref:hypothetical protein n=1 Tax=Streptomyces sp. NPDC001876 TaxID=3154402 RepID=UPI003325268E
MATPTYAPKHAKPSSNVEAKADMKSAPKHAKPTKNAEAGSEGPFRDAQEDGKVLDDMGNLLVPSLPHVPDEYLPFPGAGEALPQPEDAVGDDTYADPGKVYDPELADKLGVPVTPQDEGSTSPSDGSAGDFTLF